MSIKIIAQATDTGIKREGLSKLLAQELVEKLIEMNNSKQDIEKWQKKNILIVLCILIFFTFMAVMLFLGFAVFGILLALLFYYNQLKSVQMAYNQFRFERQFTFTEFMLLITPLLKQTSSSINLRSLFEKILPRMEYEIDRNILKRLMADMSYYSNPYYAFDLFAKQMSGTETSYLFMSILADLNNGSINLQIIDELSKLTLDEMMKGIDQIIEYKCSRFNFLFTKLLGTIAIVIIGFSIATIIYNTGNLGFVLER